MAVSSTWRMPCPGEASQVGFPSPDRALLKQARDPTRSIPDRAVSDPDPPTRVNRSGRNESRERGTDWIAKDGFRHSDPDPGEQMEPSTEGSPPPPQARHDESDVPFRSPAIHGDRPQVLDPELETRAPAIAIRSVGTIGRQGQSPGNTRRPALAILEEHRRDLEPDRPAAPESPAPPRAHSPVHRCASESENEGIDFQDSFPSAIHGAGMNLPDGCGDRGQVHQNSHPACKVAKGTRGATWKSPASPATVVVQPRPAHGNT